MCNLYKVTSNVEALTQLVQSFNRPNLPPLGEVYPNYAAPVFRPTERGIELTMLGWGVPLPARDGRKPKPKPVTNVRNLASPFWRSMAANPSRRCLVPATAFSEWTDLPDPATGRKTCRWFEMADAELFCFAGLWRPTEDGERFAFLTTEPNGVVAPIHAKAMPVILLREDYDRWLTGELEIAGELQRPVDDSALRLVAA